MRKRSMRKTAIVAAVSAVAMACGGLTAVPAAAEAAGLDVIPRVQEQMMTGAAWQVGSESRIIVDPVSAEIAAVAGVDDPLMSSRTLRETAEQLSRDLAEVTAIDVPVVISADAVAGDIRLALAADADLGAEGYDLAVDGVATVVSQTTDGIFYGGRTLLQLLRQDGTASSVAGVQMRDWPDLPYRAEHFDVSRRYMSVPEIQDEIKRASWNKLNVIQLMFNQANAFRLYSPNYAEGAPTDPGYRYSRDDIRAIERVAAEYHVTIVPEIQNPTKMQPIATIGGVDRSLAAQCNDPSTLDFTNAGVTEWFQGILEEFIPWFDGPYVHLGNDEVPGTLASCTYLKNQMAPGQTIDDLQTEYIGELETTISSLDKKSMIWVNNTKIRPSTDVLIMNFGSTAVARDMRNLGYEVVDSAYKTGAYDRFYISPSDYEGKVVPRGDIYDWTPVDHAKNVGQVLAMWGDDLFFSETNYFIDMFDGRRQELAERVWNTAPVEQTFAQFTELTERIGRAPGVAALQSVPTTTDGQPIHSYDFESTYVPEATTHYPGYWKLSLADQVGDLHGNGWIFTPKYPAEGKVGSGLGFTSSSQSLNLGGYRIEGPWSTAMWVKRTGGTGGSYILRDMDYALKMTQSATNSQLALAHIGGTQIPLGYTVPTNQWVHVAVVSDGTSTTVYADGVAVSSVDATTPLPLGGIGGRAAFIGSLDELKIYAQALDATQVAQLYASYGEVEPSADLALGRPATASSVNAAGREAGMAVDGDSSTRWGSQYSDSQWIQVDLGRPVSVESVRLNWEAAFGKSYELQVSDDAQTWRSIYSTTTGAGGDEMITGLDGTGRYIRMQGIERGSRFGYSLWDFEVYGTTS